MTDIRQWLEQQGLGSHADLLVDHEVDLEILPELRESDLEKIGLPLGSFIALPWFCCLASEAYRAAGRLEEAGDLLRKGLQFANSGSERFFGPELHRMGALILSRQSGASRKEVQAQPDDAIELAKSQGARSLQPRAAVSAAHLADEIGNLTRTRERLSTIYETFTEGLDTPDLRDARELLERLG